MSFIEILRRIPIYFWIIFILMIASFIFWRGKRGAEWELELGKEKGIEEGKGTKVIAEKVSLGLFLGFLFFFLFSATKILIEIIKREGPFIEPELLDENLYPSLPIEKLSFPPIPEVKATMSEVEVK